MSSPTPHSALIAQIMDSCTPKNEREHAACREIERMRLALDWYAEMAKQMRRGVLYLDSQHTLGMMKELALDGGKRAADAITGDDHE